MLLPDLEFCRESVPIHPSQSPSILLVSTLSFKIQVSPGFGQDRVNFHQEPGGNTAGWADPTWPNRAGYSIPCAVMLGSGCGGSGAEGRQSRLRSMRQRQAVRVGLCVLQFCFVYSPYLYRCCSCSLCLLFC